MLASVIVDALRARAADLESARSRTGAEPEPRDVRRAGAAHRPSATDQPTGV